MADYQYDLFVIGAGSGGVRAARISASYGAKVAIAEEFRIGGTCVIRGCVPKKMLVYGAQFAEELREAAGYGWTIGDAKFDWPTLRDNVLRDVDRLEGLYTENLQRHHVKIFPERATVSGPNEVTLANGLKVTAKLILIATGARPVLLDVPGAEHGITSNEVFSLPELPKRVVIAGAGYIANEFASIFRGLGSQVTVVNRTDQVLRGYDEQIRDRLLEIARRKGINYRFNAQFKNIEKRSDGSLQIEFQDHEKIEADLLLFAAGRRPNTEGLGLSDVGVELDAHGAIAVDGDSMTTLPSIFAVGDVTNRIQLTPIAIREGHAFANSQFGNKPDHVDYQNVPHAVFTNPPMAGVGLTENEARAKYGTAKVFTSDFRPMRSVLTNNPDRMLFKLVVHVETDVVLGAHLIGPEAAEILQVVAIAVTAGLTKAQFDRTTALHPSMAEELVLMR